MDVVSGIAGISQLVAYSHSTAQILIKLYKEVRGDSSYLNQHQSNVRVLLAIVDSLHQRSTSNHILQILAEVAQVAQNTLSLITRSQNRGLFGLRWASITTDSELSEAFSVLREKRDILHLAVSADNHGRLATNHSKTDIMPSSSTSSEGSNIGTTNLELNVHSSGQHCINSIGNGHPKPSRIVGGHHGSHSASFMGDRNMTPVRDIATAMNSVYSNVNHYATARAQSYNGGTTNAQGSRTPSPMNQSTTSTQGEPNQGRSGFATYGQAPRLQTSHDQASYGPAPRHQAPYNQASHGQAPRRQPPYDQASYGQVPRRQPPYDQASYGQTPRHQTLHGEMDLDQNPALSQQRMIEPVYNPQSHSQYDQPNQRQAHGETEGIERSTDSSRDSRY